MSMTNSGIFEIETGVSAGTVECEITGKQYEIESYDDRRGGTIQVENPASAHHIVSKSSRRSFVNKSPTEKAIKEAERQFFDFAGSEIVESFAAKRGDTLGQQDLSKSDGFDPEAGDFINDPQLKVTKMYEALQSAGYDDEAGYLRALPSVDEQESFADYLQESQEVDL